MVQAETDPVLLDPDLAGVTAPLSPPLTSDRLSGTAASPTATPDTEPSVVPKILSLARLYSSSRSIKVLFRLDPDLDPFPPPPPGLPLNITPPSLCSFSASLLPLPPDPSPPWKF